MHNKRPFILLTVFIILLYIFFSSGQLNKIIVQKLCNDGSKYKLNGQYEQAEKKYLEALKRSPDDYSIKIFLYDLYKTEFYKYMDAKDYQRAIPYGEKALPYDFSTSIAFDLGICYQEIENYQKAAEYYGKVVAANPNDKEAKEWMESANLNYEMNNVVAKEKAPQELYSLIKTDLDSNVRLQVQIIFDLIWTVPSGKILLKKMWESRVPVYIIETNKRPEMIPGYVNNKLTAEKIEIPLRTIKNINDTSADADFRIHSFVTFMHEFGHAYYIINTSSSQNSMEQELGVTMIGMDIAYKIITGNYMDEAAAKEISMESLEGLLADDHRELPVYSGFNQKMINLGMALPYLYVYSDIPRMYQKLLAEGRTSHVPNLDKLIE